MQIIKVFTLLLVLITVECGTNVSRKAGNPKKDGKHGRYTVRAEDFVNLFNVYDPSFMAAVWPKITNGVHILVDHSCWRDMNVFFKDFSAGKSWAYSAVDASGRYGSGLFSGNRFWLGSKEQCHRLDDMSYEKEMNKSLGNVKALKEQNFDSDGQDWRWLSQRDVVQRVPAFEHRPPYRLAYTTLLINLNITKINMAKAYDITLSVCLPRSCSSYDITSIINFSIIMNDNLKTNRTTSRIAKITTVRQILDSYDLKNDSGGILLICITVALATLAIVATVVDLNLLKCLPYNKKSMTFNLEQYNNNAKKIKNDINNIYDDKPQVKQDKVNVEIDKLAADDVTMHYMAVERMMQCGPPTISLDVNCAGSCKRCGKYKKQCNSPKHIDKLPPCPRLKYSSSASLSTDRSKRPILCRLLLCFSLNYCWKRIFNTNTSNKDLLLIHAMRIIATYWVVFVHVAIVVDYLSDNAANIDERTNVYYILATGTIAFDTLFFVSGLFSTHHFFFLKSQYSMEELVGFRGACGQVMQFVCFVTNRIIRLVPPYAYSVLLSAAMSRVSEDTATLILPENGSTNCNVYWWRSLLYISNIYPGREQCMQISWYLSTETQLHALGALVCAASVWSALRARLAVALALCAVLAATVSDASAAFFEYGRLSDVFTAYSTIINRPLARVAPYFVGVFTGWLIQIMQGSFKVSKVTSCLLWTTSASFLVASWGVPWLGVPWVAAWLHVAWPLALVWPSLICTTNYAGIFRRLLGSPSMAGLSRLCYGMILLHGAIARYMLLSADTALCSHTVCIWFYYVGTTVLSLLAALLLSLLVELPCCSLLRRMSDCAVA